MELLLDLPKLIDDCQPIGRPVVPAADRLVQPEQFQLQFPLSLAPLATFLEERESSGRFLEIDLKRTPPCGQPFGPVGRLLASAAK